MNERPPDARAAGPAAWQQALVDVLANVDTLELDSCRERVEEARVQAQLHDTTNSTIIPRRLEQVRAKRRPWGARGWDGEVLRSWHGAGLAWSCA